MDKVNLLLYQDPFLAKEQILVLEKQLNSLQASEQEILRLQLLKCETYLQLGENKAAIDLATQAEKKVQLTYVESLPYFIGCRADAHASIGNLTTALPLLDSAINLAKLHNQPQALSNLLRLRGQLDTENENYLSAIEDLRLALDIYDEINQQKHHWSWPPKAYLYAAMGNLLYASGDLQQALNYAYKGLQRFETQKKIRHVLLLNTARMALDNDQLKLSNQLLKEAKELLPSQSSPLEKAYSFGIMASIEIDKKNYDIAETMIKSSLITFKKQNKQVSIMQMQRLQALILFAQGKNNAALNLIHQAINAGKHLKQYSYLEIFYRIVSNYYAENKQHDLAYQYLQLSFEASQKANHRISNIRFIQFKARLSRQVSEDVAKIKPNKLQQLINLKASSLIIVSLLTGVIVIFILLWFLVKSTNKPKRCINNTIKLPLNSYEEAIESTMMHAKKNDQPFNLLIIDTGKINRKNIERIEVYIKKKLRKQDAIFYYSPESLLILLPFTTDDGTQRVVRQLEISLQPWLTHTEIKIGAASMKHFDTAKSLIKRAIANQVCHQKASEIKLMPHSAR